ncbi:GNAT family N-acetyltransferase [uncultured Tateyamaria sp.]|uniref:GNAT family N-acetyltransferase n=1 Tax=uncultured Tateyamaria sp. TaxID=455651 RepID=UPI0026076E86|nr:GNAT family N-acetyltransferase [uncultured Tateyamaria sp.]
MSTRTLTAADTAQALTLYRHLVGDQLLASGAAFADLLDHPGTFVWGAFEADHLLAMATLHILPNMTQGGRPYALVENVVTHPEYRGTGQGRRVMQAVIDAAWAADCYKIMLLTGRSAEARGFYEKLGFGADEKWGMTIRRAPVR